MNQSGCCWTTRSMAASTSESRAAFLRTQNVSGSPMPYLHAVAAGEAGAEGAVVGVGEGAAALGEVAGAGADGVDPPPQDDASATIAPSETVRTRRNFIPSLPAGGPTIAPSETVRTRRNFIPSLPAGG